MRCFICNLYYEDNYNNPASILISDGVTKKTAFTYKDMLKGFLCGLINVQMSETDIICRTCQNLIECYDAFYYEAKICQEILMRQIYRNFKIPKNEQQLSLNLLDYDVEAASHLYSKNNQINVYECKLCEYKTKYTDTLASHYKFHKCSSENLSSENLQNAIELTYQSTCKAIEPKITLPLRTSSPTIEIYDVNINNNNDATVTDFNNHNFEFINSDNNNDHKQNYDDTLQFQVEPNISNAQGEIPIKDEIDEDMDFLTEELSSDVFGAAFLSNKFVCGECDKQFLNKNKFFNHLKSHGKYFKCSYCESISLEKDIIEEHILRNHSSNLEYCVKCRTRTLNTPCDHKYTKNLNPRKVSKYCQYCPEGSPRFFQKQNNLIKHNILQHLKCDECNKQFPSRKLGLKHLYTFHTGLHKIRCTGCRNVFKTPMDKKLHNCNGKFKLKCKLCPKTYNTTTLLKQHAVIHSNTALYVCDECGQTFVHNGSYIVHKKYHLNPKPYKCNICELALTTHSALLNHIRRHNGELEYKCDYCDKKFVTLTLKKWHESVHTGNYRYNCNDCIKGFNKRYLYARHLRIVHKDYSVKKPECQYKMAIPKQSLATTVQINRMSTCLLKHHAFLQQQLL